VAGLLGRCRKAHEGGNQRDVCAFRGLALAGYAHDGVCIAGECAVDKGDGFEGDLSRGLFHGARRWQGGRGGRFKTRRLGRVVRHRVRQS